MTLTLRSASTTTGTTKGSALTHAEMDANWLHALQSANTGFVPSGIGAVATTLQARGRLEVWAEDFGAVGDGVTNDTTAINAAITAVAIRGGTVRFAAKDYKVTSIVLKPGVYLKGMGSGKRASLNVTRLVGTAGSDIITFPDQSVSDVALLNIKLNGGRRHLYFNPTGTTDSIINLWLEDVHLEAPSAECVYIGGQSERQLFKYVYFANGTYGYRHDKGSRASFGIFEKSTWEHIYFEGQSEDAVFFDTIANSGSTHFNFTKIISCQKHAWHIKGNFGGMVWTVPMFENCGLGGGSLNTTGSITSATATLTVASGTGSADGNSVSVRGAGVSGADLNTTISSGGGTTTWTLADNASTTVASEYVTTRTYDIFNFDIVGGFGNATNVTIIGGFLNDATTSQVRYMINNEGGWVQEILLLGVSGHVGGNSAPVVYDPQMRVTAIASPIGIRVAYSGVRPIFQRGEVTSLPDGRIPSTGEYTPVVIGAPRGKNFTVFMEDSAGNGTGTVGNFDIHTSDPNVTRIWNLNGTNAVLSTRGKMQPGNFTSATGGATLKDEGSKGFIYGNAAPTAGTWVVGDVVMNAVPAVGQPIGWSCTVAGTPGTWVAWANL